MILGLSFSHNATACVVDAADGKLLFCCSEERFTRRKNEWGIPARTLDYIFKHVASPDHFSRVAVGESCLARFGSRRFADLMYLSNYAVKDRHIRSKARLAAVVAKECAGRILSPKRDYRALVRRRLADIGLSASVTFTDHHTAHAGSAFYCSPFDEALVVTLDGEGDGLSGSCWLGRGAKLQLVDTLPEVASAGKFYRSITSLLGFKLNRHEGKVTGLAAYGDAERFYPQLREFLRTTHPPGGGARIVSKAAEHHLRRFNLRNVRPFRLLGSLWALLRADEWESLLNYMVRKQFREMYQSVLPLDCKHLNSKDMADIAAAAQRVLEEAVLDYVNFHLDRSPSKNVALAGGVFANVRLNQAILERLDTERIYIHPGMGDEGLALGAAMLACHEGKECKAQHAVPGHVYVGPAYDDADIETALRGTPHVWHRTDTQTVVETVVQALIDEQVVGLYRGRMEYGPRALGHRTILVNPIKREINDVVNRRLRRTEFMPFAPVVLDECYADIFDSSKLNGARFACNFMTVTLNVRPQWRDRIQGVVHLDSTARPQVIRETDDPVYYRIVRLFFERTGIGCVVNTSFNIHEEPIVNDPRDALRAFADGAVDLLVMEEYIVRRSKSAEATTAVSQHRETAREPRVASA